LFDHVYVIRGGRHFKKQLAFTLLLLPKLFLNRYDIVLDLNDAIISRLVRKMLLPRAWATFDKFSALPAGIRTQLTIDAVGLGKITANTRFKVKDEFDSDTTLKKNGWRNNNQLVILNPAGAFETRNWPVEHYVRFSKMWIRSFPQTQFLVLGVTPIAEKAEYLGKEFGNNLINLVNKTTPAEAFSIIQRVQLVLTEDSGLMHMAWVSGIPTLAIFGSTKAYHARPLGEKSFLFDSSDLPCGNCMLEFCKYGDTHCLTRITPEAVFQKAKELVGQTR
jgi:ADP-heptose:LPS heptosyltransferase